MRAARWTPRWSRRTPTWWCFQAQPVSGDEVYVTAAGERVTDISKNPTIKEASVGELVGISKISRALFERMVLLADLDPSAEYETGA